MKTTTNAKHVARVLRNATATGIGLIGGTLDVVATGLEYAGIDADKSVKDSFNDGLNAPRSMVIKMMALTDGEIEEKARKMADATGKSYEDCLKEIKLSIES